MSYLDRQPLAIRKNLLLVLASILLLAGVSQADDLILDPIALKFTKTPWAEGTSLELPKFDPALGTLQSVSMSLVGRAQSFGILFNSGNFDETVFVTVESLLGVKLSDTLSAQVKVTGISATEDVIAGDSTPSPTAMGTRTKVFVFSDSLSTFIGTGTVHLQLSEHTTTAVTGASTVRYTSPRTSAGIEITVTYNYSRPTLVRFIETSLVDGGHSVEMTVVGPAQSLCRLEFISSLDLTSPSWEKVGEAVIPASGQVVFKVQNSKKLNGSFFRATIP